MVAAGKPALLSSALMLSSVRAPVCVHVCVHVCVCVCVCVCARARDPRGAMQGDVYPRELMDLIAILKARPAA